MIKKIDLNLFMRVSNIHIKIFSGIVLLLILSFSVTPLQILAQSREVVAKNGDGVQKLLKRNGIDPLKYTDAFIELNKTRLGDNNTLFTGVKYRLPDIESADSEKTKDNESSNVIVDGSKPDSVANSGAVNKSALPGKTLDLKIFGAKYADVQVKSNDLAGAVYYLTSGHGGPDPGAMGNYQKHVICEDEYAYDVTLRLARNLIELGAKVYMITIDKNDGIRDEMFLMPDKDEVCYTNLTIPLNQTRRLQQRVDVINQLYTRNKGLYQRLIEIHVDSRGKDEDIDLFFYYDIKSNTGKKTATILKQTFEKKYREVQPGRGYSGTVSNRNLYSLKNTYPTGVYIELGNMNHQRDIKRLVIPDNRQAVANWLTLGLVQDYKTNR